MVAYKLKHTCFALPLVPESANASHHTISRGVQNDTTQLLDLTIAATRRMQPTGAVSIACDYCSCEHS